MAEAFLQVLLDNLTSLIQGEIGLIMGVNDEMNKLSSTLTTIQAVLQDAEDRQLQDRAVRDWLHKLNDLSYEIDDVLDECATDVAKLEYQRGKSSVFNVKILKKLLYQHKFGRKIKAVVEKLDAVAAERAKFHLRETTVVSRSKFSAGRETGSVLNESHHVYGRDEDREKIVDILVNQVRDHDQLSVVPILGVGGLGKTTLAQLVYNDDRVAEHFDIKLWVCVSDDFDPKTLIKAMIESTTRCGRSSNLEHLDSLQHSLLMELSQKRYLLVLDDVWNQDQDKWFVLKDLLACGSPGSSIIVTTRLKKVADIMSTVPAHLLKGLSEENCWLLFKQRAFKEVEEVHANLEVIGMQIVVKCRGVPLAAKALGGLLRFKRQEVEWIRVKESEIWNLPEEECSILPALRLSYHHLPFELRRCFAYCAAFPKDSWIKKKELILQWIAQGHISSSETLEAEDIGNEIVNELVLRSLFQNVREPDSTEDMSFQMHDLVHDLAQSIMDNRVPGGSHDGHISNHKIRHVDLVRNFVAFPTSVVLDMNLPTVFMQFSRLRTLDASGAGIEEISSAIGSLKHVRYLNLSRNHFQTLPDTLCCLWNLKILNLNWCRKLVCLPQKMKRLRNLRHLFLYMCDSLSQMPPKIGELTSLKTLSMFVASQGKHNQLGELQFMDLGDRLHIEHLERVEDPMDACKANLREKQNLHRLEFNWKKDESCKLHEAMDEKVLQALEPHANVKILWIDGFRGKFFPCWMQSYSTMENLTMLYLWNCPSCLSLPQVLGDLPYLKSLSLENLGADYIIEDEVQCSNSRKPKFPCVEMLWLRELPHLKGLVKEKARVAFPNLERLNVHGCPSFTLPQLSSLKSLSCSSVILPSFYKLVNLTNLVIDFNGNMNFVPSDALENLINLKTLRILDGNEHSLPDEGLQFLKSLRVLDIMSTNTLTFFPDKWLSHLTALVTLCLHHCPELVEIPEGIKCLHNLAHLHLNNLPKMVCLPDSLQHLTSLQTLSLLSLYELTSLPDWLGSFTALISLDIWYCPKLVSFPASIRELKRLRSLAVIDCPELWRRCANRNGEDWHKISHISYRSNKDDDDY